MMTNVIDIFTDLLLLVSKLRHEAVTQSVRIEAELNPKKFSVHQAACQSKFSLPSNAGWCILFCLNSLHYLLQEI